jgi:hypothetical protein
MTRAHCNQPVASLRQTYTRDSSQPSQPDRSPAVGRSGPTLQSPTASIIEGNSTLTARGLRKNGGSLSDVLPHCISVKQWHRALNRFALVPMLLASPATLIRGVAIWTDGVSNLGEFLSGIGAGPSSVLSDLLLNMHGRGWSNSRVLG